MHETLTTGPVVVVAEIAACICRKWVWFCPWTVPTPDIFIPHAHTSFFKIHFNTVLPVGIQSGLFRSGFMSDFVSLCNVLSCYFLSPGHEIGQISYCFILTIVSI